MPGTIEQRLATPDQAVSGRTGPPFVGCPRRTAVPSVAVNDMPSPEHVGPYRLVERIGEGGMGVVHLAISPESSPESGLVALKMLRPWLVGDRKSTRLNSSHVASSYAVFCLRKK